MPTLAETTVFDAHLERLAGDAALPAQARAALDWLAEHGLPAKGDETWRFTDLSSVRAQAWKTPAEVQAPAVTQAQVDAWVGEEPVVVLVNGAWSASLSRLPAGVTAGSLAERRDRIGEVAGATGELAGQPANPFTALNTAHLGESDGLFLELAPGQVLERPLYLLHFSGGEALSLHPRTLVLAGANSQATLAEVFVTGAGTSLHNQVSELVLDDGARITHLELQEERGGLHLLHGLYARVGRAARYERHAFQLGGPLVRVDTCVKLDGEGAEASIHGAYVLRGSEQVDNHTWLEHARPRGTSAQDLRGVLSDKARGVFDGQILVQHDAAHTSADQSNRNLLLSEDALAHSNPRLQIYTDEVRCTHGSAIGQLDPDALFYLRSRGFPIQQARELLTYASISDLVDQVPLPAFQAHVLREVRACLPGGGEE
jgi:Fe-S cluster assembly protein SufD